MRPRSCSHPRHHRGFFARARAKPVIDREHRELWRWLAFGTRVSHEVKQSHAVGAARHRKRKPGEAERDAKAARASPDEIGIAIVTLSMHLAFARRKDRPERALPPGKLGQRSVA